MDRFFKEDKMKCVVCKGSDIEIKTVDEQIRKGRDIILVPMSILVCSNCGERYYDRKSMRKIEDIRNKVQNQELDVEEIGKVMRAHAA
jgi:YgiT-type zinc finger domain-containing protein